MGTFLKLWPLGLTFLLSGCLHTQSERRYPVGQTSDPSEREILESAYPENMAGIESRFAISNLQRNGWAPFDKQTSVGVLYRSYLAVKPLELELGGFFDYERVGGGSNPLQRLRFYEIDLGLAVSAPLGGGSPDSRRSTSIEPYAGAGLAVLIGRTDEAGSSGYDQFHDADTGYYVHSGVRLYLQGRNYISIDWRWLRGAELDLGRGSISADQNDLSIGFGVAF